MKLILSLIFFCSILIADNIINIDSSTSKIKDFTIEYLIDTTSKLEFNDVLNKKFIVGKNRNSLGAKITNSWIKIKLFNSTEKKQTLYLHQDQAFTFVSMKYYEVDDKNNLLNTKVMSKLLPNEKKNINGADSIYKFHLESKQTKTIYVHQKTFAYHFYDYSIRSEKESINFLIYEKVDGVLFVGLLFALAIYNLFIYFSSKYKEYLYYSLYLTSATLWIFYMYGSLAHYFHVYGGLSTKFNFGLMLTPVFLALFVQTIFETKIKYKTEHLFLNSIIILLLLNILYAIIDFNHALQLLSSSLNYALVMFMLISISIYKKGDKIIKIFLVAHTFYLVFNIYALLFYMGLVDFTYISSHGIGIGIIIEALILSYLVSYKFKIIEEEKEIEKIEKIKAETRTKLKSEFLAKMSHEIRTPMNGITGMLQILMKTKLDEKQKKYMATINNSTKGLLNIINDLLDFSKIEAEKLSIKKTNFSLSELLSDIANLESIKAKQKGLDFQISYSSNINLYRYGDSFRIAQILTNIINNAIKFTHKGYVHITIENNEEDTINFNIIDSGIGMSEKQINSLFQPFNQVHEKNMKEYGGTGLGLFITKQLVALMNGKIVVSSNKNEGSSFLVSLPLPESLRIIDNTIVTDRKIEKSISILKGSTILLVDDNEINRDIIVGLLENSGIKIDIAVNGKEALSLYNDSHDLILMDLQMPVMDGYEATKQIRQINLDIPIIALSANSKRKDIEKTKLYEMQEYLMKPIDADELYSVLFKYLEK